MQRHRKFAVLTLLVAGSLACLPHRPSERESERLDRALLTEKDFADLHVETAYEAIETLRSTWLKDRGPLTFTGAPAVVLVYLDNVKFGGVETLRSLPLHRVSSIRRLDGVQAQARYGVGHAAGVLEVETWTLAKNLPVPRDLSGDMIVIENDSASSRAMPADANPRFDWFEYQGNDPALAGSRASGAFRNPILTGFYPDPSAIRVGDDYYLVTSSFAYFPGVPIFKSKDLVNWTQIGHVLDRRSQLNLDSAGISRGIFAPVIRYNAGTFYMITTLIDKGGNFIVTATNPAGPWSDPIWLRSVDGIDPSLFFDDNGKAYVLNNGPPIERPRYDGHRAIWIQEFDVAAKRMVGPRTLIVNGGTDLSKNPIWIEAPHIFKRNGQYYLICAEGGTGYNHTEVVFKSDSPLGPWVPFAGNPILTQKHLDPARPNPITTTGHADFIETQNGEWWAVFLGVRPYGDDTYNTGRETFLMPVKWVDGWPIITSGTETVPYVAKAPALPAQPSPSIPTSGDFRVRDDFSAPTLPMHWEMIRGPGDTFVDLTTSPGALTLRARRAGFERFVQPSFVGRRQQHINASASTAMTYQPAADGDKAGMVAFQNDRYFYFLAVARVDGKTVVRVEKHAGGPTGATGTVVASVLVDVSGSQPIYLKIDARGALYDFSYATTPGQWISLHAGADGTILSTKVAGGFVGAMFGLYAFSPAGAD